MWHTHVRLTCMVFTYERPETKGTSFILICICIHVYFVYIICFNIYFIYICNTFYSIYIISLYIIYIIYISITYKTFYIVVITHGIVLYSLFIRLSCLFLLYYAMSQFCSVSSCFYFSPLSKCLGDDDDKEGRAREFGKKR